MGLGQNAGSQALSADVKPRLCRYPELQLLPEQKVESGSAQ